MKPAGEPAEGARAALHLASDEASYVTGVPLDVTVAIDGGLMRR